MNFKLYYSTLTIFLIGATTQIGLNTTIAILLILELTARLAQLSKREPPENFVKYELRKTAEANKSMRKRVPILGTQFEANYRGKTTLVMPLLNEDIHYSVSTDTDGCRKTSEAPEEFEGKPMIALLGASHSFGNGVDDNETFAWKLQERFPNYNVKNFSVGSFNSASQYFKLKQILATELPEVVLFYFCPSVDVKITGNFKWMKKVYSPTVTCTLNEEKLNFHPATSYFSSPAAKYIKVLEIVEYIINTIRFVGRAGDHKVQILVEHILLQLRELCENQGVTFIVAAGRGAREYFRFLGTKGFSWIPCSLVGGRYMEDDVRKWSFFPIDSHPNQRAHQQIAQTIGDALDQHFAGRIVKPEQIPIDFNQAHNDHEIPMDYYPLF